MTVKHKMDLPFPISLGLLLQKPLGLGVELNTFLGKFYRNGERVLTEGENSQVGTPGNSCRAPIGSLPLSKHVNNNNHDDNPYTGKTQLMITWVSLSP